MTDITPGSEMGRFEFDGAEGIAFWIDLFKDESKPSTHIRFEDLEVLKAFLEYNLPGLFKPEAKYEYGIAFEGEDIEAEPELVNPIFEENRARELWHANEDFRLFRRPVPVWEEVTR